MLSWILQITIISVIFIFLVHHLFEFFKSTLTVPKIKDLVNSPTQKYENMLNIINSHGEHNSLEYASSTNINNLNSKIALGGFNDELLPKPDVKSMKNELKNFLKKQLNDTSSNVNEKIGAENKIPLGTSSVDFGSVNYSNY